MRIYRDGVEMETDGPVRVRHTREGHVVECFRVKGKPKFFATLAGTPYCAHGDTVAEAVADAVWKDPARRPSLDALKKEIREAGPERKITLMEFRTLTGACSEGCRHALAQAGLDGSPTTAYDIRDKISPEWGEKLLSVLGWPDDRPGKTGKRAGKQAVDRPVEPTRKPTSK